MAVSTTVWVVIVYAQEPVSMAIKTFLVSLSDLLKVQLVKLVCLCVKLQQSTM